MSDAPALPRSRLEQSLDEAMSRLDVALRDPSPSAAAERELLASLRPADGGFSFAAGAAQPDEGTAAGLLDDLIERARTQASVDTRSEGRVVASTRVGRGGSVVSNVTPTLEPELLQQHLDELAGEVRRHQERTALVVSTMQMASKIALAAGTGNPLLAIPAAVRFIRQIMAEQDEQERR